jgi:hypothetical protein
MRKRRTDPHLTIIPAFFAILYETLGITVSAYVFLCGDGNCEILYLICKFHFLFCHNNSSKLKSGDENNLCICPLFTMSVTER